MTNGSCYMRPFQGASFSLFFRGQDPLSLSLSLITRITDGEGDDDGRDKHCRRRRWPPYAASDPPPHPPCLQAMAIIPPLSHLSHPHHQVSGNNKLPPSPISYSYSLSLCLYLYSRSYAFFFNRACSPFPFDPRVSSLFVVVFKWLCLDVNVWFLPLFILLRIVEILVIWDCNSCVLDARTYVICIYLLVDVPIMSNCGSFFGLIWCIMARGDKRTKWAKQVVDHAPPCLVWELNDYVQA